MPNFDLSLRDRDDQFALRFRGYLTVPTTGVYRFWVRADQGARLYLDRSLVVDNAVPQEAVEADGEAALAAGAHSLAVIYFEQTGDQALEVSFAGPGIEKQRIPDSALSHQPN
jgi:hypothetical protein